MLPMRDLQIYLIDKILTLHDSFHYERTYERIYDVTMMKTLSSEKN